MRHLLVLALSTATLLCLICPRKTFAAGPQFGGCIVWEDEAKTSCKIETGPSVAVTVGKYQEGKFSAGLLPGIGYGATLYPERWYAVGLALYGQLQVGGSEPSSGAFSGLLSFANYVRLGGGKTWVEQSSGPAKGPWCLLFGLGTDFGGSPSYVRDAARK
jgi:hypothetical protein